VNKKGYTLMELMIVIVIFGIFASMFIPAVFKFMDDEKIAQKTGSIIKEFKQESSQEIKIKTITVDRSGIKCINGKKAIEIDSKIYYIGFMDTWDDIKSIDCK